MNDLDNLIRQLEDPFNNNISLTYSEVIVWLRELKELRELVRKQSAIIESQARYIERYIDRR